MKNRNGLTILREALGMSLQEFASELEVSRGTLWKWEKELPERINRKICIQFGLDKEIDLQKDLDFEQESYIRDYAWNYLVNKRDGMKKTLKPDWIKFVYHEMPNEPITAYCYCTSKLGGKWQEVLMWDKKWLIWDTGFAIYVPFKYTVLAWYPLPDKPIGG